MAVTIAQAACNALATYLSAQLSGVTVTGRWPAPGKPLPEKAVTILRTGEPQYEKLDLKSIAYTSVDPTTGEYTWQLRVATQQLQLDIWSRYERKRDDLCAQLEDALTKGELVTLGRSGGAPFRDGVLLELNPADDWEGNVDFTFGGTYPNDNPEAARKSEWRATCRGECSMVVTAKAQSPKLLAVKLRIKLGEGALGTGPAFDIDISPAP